MGYYVNNLVSLQQKYPKPIKVFHQERMFTRCVGRDKRRKGLVEWLPKDKAPQAAPPLPTAFRAGVCSLTSTKDARKGTETYFVHMIFLKYPFEEGKEDVVIEPNADTAEHVFHYCTESIDRDVRRQP